MGTKVYFFNGGQYARYDRGADATDDGYPLRIGDQWPGMAGIGFGTDLDCALNLGGGKVYFFRGDSYVRYDVNADRADDGYPLRIADQWHGMADVGFGVNLDAAVQYDTGKAYFFKGDQYVRYDIAADHVDDGYPLRTADQWAGLGSDRLDAAVHWGNGKLFFFRGDQYLRYDIAADRVDDGYPLRIADQWPGLLPAIGGVQAVTDLYDENHTWLPEASQELPPSGGEVPYIPGPWRGVLHTTEGSTVDGALQAFRVNNSWPHLTIDPNAGTVLQHFPLSVGARSLQANLTPTNSLHCVQIEIVGFAAQAPTWAPERLAFIRDIMRSVENIVPVQRTSGLTFLDEHGVNAQPGNRMGVDAWKRFAGWCGHQHVPGNTHWDPGAIDIDALLSGS